MSNKKSMNSVYGLNNPLQKVNPLPIIVSRNPTENDISYPVGQEWINESNNEVWKLTSVSSGVAFWVLLGVGNRDIETLTGDIGAAVGPDISYNLNIVGGVGISTTGTPGTNTITIDASGIPMIWTREAGAAVALIVNQGYINTNAGLTTFTLPAVALVGDIIEIAGEGAGGWTIAQNAGQSIQFGNISTTVGVGGTLNPSNRYDTVKILCRVANTTWSVLRNLGVLNAL